MPDDETLVKQGSPTLAGLKTGNLFPVRYGSPDELRTDLTRLNRRLGEKGLRILPVQYGGGRALLYLYRPARLKKDLADGEAIRLLSEMGYPVSSSERCLAMLMHKFQSGSPFPHEVGLFLSYPPEDVRGFMQNHAAGSKCVGCWKVYGDEVSARKTFGRYRSCTRAYCEQWKKGKSIEQLIVAV